MPTVSTVWKIFYLHKIVTCMCWQRKPLTIRSSLKTCALPRKTTTSRKKTCYWSITIGCYVSNTRRVREPFMNARAWLFQLESLFQALLARIQERHTWPGIRKSIGQYVSQCLTCQQVRDELGDVRFHLKRIQSWYRTLEDAKRQFTKFRCGSFRVVYEGVAGHEGALDGWSS